MDFRNKSNIRGLRNNNPGNLEKSKSPWQGKVPHNQNTDGRFEQFESIEMGLRALMINARTLINRGKNTIEKLIYTWAPPSENNSKNYADYVAKQMGIAKDKVFEKLDKDFFIRLAKAITAVENGENSLKQIPNSAFEKAHSLIGFTQYIAEKKKGIVTILAFALLISGGYYCYKHIKIIDNGKKAKQPTRDSKTK